MSGSRTLIIASVILVNISIFFVFKNLIDFRQLIREEEDLRRLGVTIFENARTLKPFTLRDTSNQPFSKASLRKPLNLFFFGFTECPDICPITLREYNNAFLMKEFATIADSIDFYFVSVDPSTDSPEVISSYLDSYSAKIFGLSDIDQSKNTSDEELGFGVSSLAAELFVSYSDTASLIESQDNTEEHRHSEFPPERANMITHSGHISIINKSGEHVGVIRSPHRSEDLLNAFTVISDNHMIVN
ncbi:SCO family protein [Gammaproteobacteria bacterium]|nr:SCO family protein [Gammaproteobacteria bacterium]MDB2444453.1 SCO family protein [Gammaproteobacteria bacterium]